jgi:hypothetical protein
MVRMAGDSSAGHLPSQHQTDGHVLNPARAGEAMGLSPDSPLVMLGELRAALTVLNPSAFVKGTFGTGTADRT